MLEKKLPKQNLVIFIAGEGGHYEQAKRLLDLLELKNKTNIVFLTDLPNECKMDNIFHEHLGVIRSKQGFSPFGALCYFRKAVVTTLHYCLNYNDTAHRFFLSPVSSPYSSTTFMSMMLKICSGFTFPQVSHSLSSAFA